MTGLYDDTATNIDGILNTAFGNATGVVATMGNAKFTIANACYLLSARTRDYKIEAGHSTLQKLSASIKPDGGIDRGISLHDHIAAAATGAFASANNLDPPVKSLS